MIGSSFLSGLLVWALPALSGETTTNDPAVYRDLDEAKARFSYDANPKLPDKVHEPFRRFVAEANAMLDKGMLHVEVMARMEEGELFLPKVIDIHKAQRCDEHTAEVCVKAAGMKGCSSGRMRACAPGAKDCKTATMKCETPTLNLCTEVRFCDEAKEESPPSAKDAEKKLPTKKP